MRHWLQLGIRNWRVKPGRTAGALAAIALGVGVVVWVTCSYESVRLAIRDQVWFWIGKSHLSIESVFGSRGTVYESLAEEVRQIPNVAHVTSRLKYLVNLHLPAGGRGSGSEPGLPVSTLPAAGDAGGPAADPGITVEAVGIDPTTEYHFRDYEQRAAEGSRMLRPGDTDAAVVERTLAAQIGLRIGDRFILGTARRDVLDRPSVKQAAFRVVGLLEHRRVAQQQEPVVIVMLDQVKALAQFDDDIPRVTKIDLMLKDTAPPAMWDTLRKVRQLADRQGERFVVTSASARIKQVEQAETQTKFVLMLISSVALFTGFFIILSTLSMGMVERLGQLGTLRCLGVTRTQMGTLVLSEAAPMGVVGILLGIPFGLILAKLSVWIAPEYIGHFVVNRQGLVLALVGGGVTTLAGALLPVVQAMRVSPLAASRPQSRPTPAGLTWSALVVGLAMIVSHTVMIDRLRPDRWFTEPLNPVAGVSLLYCGYALITPALIVIVGRGAVFLIAKVLAVRHQLLSDQVGRAAWRSGAICCGLMVGLSMIVTLVVHSESLAAGWDFPKDFFEAFVYVSPPTARTRADQVRRLPGIKSSALVNESIRCTIFSGKGWFNFPFSNFVAGDPDEFFEQAKLEFVEGNKQDAMAKLKRGGYILVTPEFTRAKQVSIGDKVSIMMGGSGEAAPRFEIAGVVTSPALEIAASYFNASGMLMSKSVFVAMGTFEDARRIFKVPDQATLYLINFDLPENEIPPEFHGDSPPAMHEPTETARMLARWRAAMPERAAEMDRIQGHFPMQAGPAPRLPGEAASLLALFRDAMNEVAKQWPDLSPSQRLHNLREELVMRLLASRGGGTWSRHASARALKVQIDRDLRRATALFATIPMVALVVAALGVANLMMANVASRARQIAMLRAVGTTKWQVMRLVIGEAVVLGAIGSLLGVVLGFHAARSLNAITLGVWGYKPHWTVPWDWVGLGVAFTMGVCLLAGLLPAARAGRTNIINALQTT